MAVSYFLVRVFNPVTMIDALDGRAHQGIDFAVGPDFAGLALLLALTYRLHDLGWSGWWLVGAWLLDMVMTTFLLALWPLPLPFGFGFFVIAAFFSLVRGQPSDNKWGPVPWPVKRATATTLLHGVVSRCQRRARPAS